LRIIGTLIGHGMLLESIKTAEECISHCEAKHHKPWFEEECSKVVDQRRQAKPQWF
jgi:hypothetical protein